MKRNRHHKLRWLVFLTFMIPVLLYPSFSRWPNRENSVDRYIALYPEAARTGGIWDPVAYIFNPIKRGYTEAADFSLGVFATLPPNAQYWDDESKAAYPLEYYYRDVLEMRTDVSLNRIFGLVMEEPDAQNYARRMLRQLKQGSQVYLSALVEPEREVLNQLFVLLSPESTIESIRQMDTEEFASEFPVYRFDSVPLVTDRKFEIYQIQKRRTE